MGIDRPILDVIEYTDPYCTWCWGSEPILRKIREVYGGQVQISFKMGGLVENVDTFYDPLNKIGGSPERMAEQVAVHWLEASGKHGMPVDAQLAPEVLREMRSTYPASVACKAAQMQSKELGDRFIRRMREAAAAEGMLVHRKEVQAELAREVGLDVERFLIALQDGSAEASFRADLKEARSMGITGFPTFLVRNAEGRDVLLPGYRSFEAFERTFQVLVGEKLVRLELDVSKESVRAFVAKYGKVATKEVCEVFGVGPEQANEVLEALLREGAISKVVAGNGFFWLARLPR